MKNLLAISIVTAAVSLTFQPAYSAGQDMPNATSGGHFAGYGYTHGTIPVTDAKGYYDSDIWRYDINKSKPAENYYNQEDLNHYYGTTNNPQLRNYNE